MTESDAEAKSDSEARALVETFMKQLDVDENVASILVQEGFSTIEEIAYVPASELNGIEEFDEEIVKELRTRARDVLHLNETGCLQFDDVLIRVAADAQLEDLLRAFDIDSTSSPAVAALAPGRCPGSLF